MDKDEAIEKALEVIEVEVGPGLVHPTLGQIVIQIDNVDEHELGWIVPFNSTAYLDTGNPEFAFLPGVLVVPHDGDAPYAPPSYLPTREYLDSIVKGVDHP
jgi:hypothetical protein